MKLLDLIKEKVKDEGYNVLSCGKGYDGCSCEIDDLCPCRDGLDLDATLGFALECEDCKLNKSKNCKDYDEDEKIFGWESDYPGCGFDTLEELKECATDEGIKKYEKSIAEFLK